MKARPFCQVSAKGSAVRWSRAPSKIFVFYTSQLAGIAGLMVDLVAYGLVRYALSREIAAAAHANPSTGTTPS